MNAVHAMICKTGWQYVLCEAKKVTHGPIHRPRQVTVRVNTPVVAAEEMKA